MGDSATLTAAVSLFDAGEYLAAHELFEELWEDTQGSDADFYKGCLQASIALHHYKEGNLAGAVKLFAGHRRFLAAYMPIHLGYDVSDLITEMQRCLQPVLRMAADADPASVAFRMATRPSFKMA